MKAIERHERVYQERVYKSSEIAAFRKTAEIFGGLSNMAPGYPIKINGITILTTEALYQACRFPHMPEVQERILKERSPMTAKMVGKPFRSHSRVDFEQVKIDIMRWCLRVKLAQNFLKFGKLLETTNNMPIVEDSHKDAFWGAMRDKSDSNTLKGVNALGRLLMELRHQYFENRYSNKIFKIEPLQISNFKLLGVEIESVDERFEFLDYIAKQLYTNNERNIIHPNNHYTSQALYSNEYSLQTAEYKPVIKKPIKSNTNKKVISNNQDSEEKSEKNKPSKAKVIKPLPLFNS